MMRGQNVCVVFALVTIIAIGPLLFNIDAAQDVGYRPPCPPWCFLTYGTVEASGQISTPSSAPHPFALTIAESERGQAERRGLRALVYTDKTKKVEVEIGDSVNVAAMFKKDIRKEFGFIVLAGRKDNIPLLIAFVPADPKNHTIKPDQTPKAQKALREYMEAFEDLVRNKK
jgi:hypothetical protein